jgi:hypothetical protein
MLAAGCWKVAANMGLIEHMYTIREGGSFQVRIPKNILRLEVGMSRGTKFRDSDVREEDGAGASGIASHSPLLKRAPIIEASARTSTGSFFSCFAELP